MKKPLLIVIIILVVILFLPAVNFIRWTFQEKKPMNILILDKTSSTIDREQHRSLTWVLVNDRFVKKTKKTSYSLANDYFGFHVMRPLRDKDNYKMRDLKFTSVFKFADSCDVLYYTDTYGVYMNDWYRGISNSRKSRKLYGGINNTDWIYFKEMQDSGKLVILESNTIDYPTPDLEKYKIKGRLGIEFAGWRGKYFRSLDTTAKGNEDFPIWMTSVYRKANRAPWTFTKPGVVFLRGNEIVVLEEGTHLKSGLPFITTDSVYRAKYGIPEKVEFQGWFDVIDPLKTNVISTFNLETTAAGDTLLFENFLTGQFPAVITDTTNHRTYYFAGDFATSQVPFWISRFKGIDKLKGIFYSDKNDDPRRFFWVYYRPLINGILSDYYKEMKPE
jgi:hypothetical protein